jgi:glycine betaine/choline ABC-type transport system substrate-binding protein
MVRTACALLIGLLAAGCSSKQRIIVGSKNFTEQVLLGELIAQHIEQRLQIPVDRRLNLGGTLLAHEAVKSGGIDLYPEYTGTALTAVLKAPVERDRNAVLTRVREGYRPLRLAWMDPLGFDNTFAMVIRSDLARRDNLRTITEAAKRSAPWRLGVGYEFVQRPDGLKGLVETYSLRLAGAPMTMDLGLLYPALQSNRIDMAAASATDGQLARAEFTVLADDRQYFPPYECAIVVREETLDRFSGLRGALGELSARISDTDMRRMNAAVDIEHRPVTEVVREFLRAPARRVRMQ